MKKVILHTEDYYNESGYADFLSNEEFHHSDKGCQIEMKVVKRGRPGERKVEVVIKHCLTHGVDCHKEGWQIGHYNKVRLTCDCGKELTGRNVYCNDCKKRLRKERNRIMMKKIRQIL